MSKSRAHSKRRTLCRVSRHVSIKNERRAWNQAERHADKARLRVWNWEEEDAPPPPRPVNPWSLTSDGFTWDDDLTDDDLRK